MIKTLKILSMKGHKMNPNNLVHSVGLTRDQYGPYRNLLNKMVNNGWIKQEDSTEYKGGNVYSLTDQGSEFYQYLKKMYDEQPTVEKLIDGEMQTVNELDNLKIFFEWEETGST